MKKKIDTQNNTPLSVEDQKLESTMKRYIGGLFEEFNGRVKAITEVSRGQLNDIQKTLDHHTEILDQQSYILNTHTKILNNHSKTLMSHTERIGSILMDNTEIKRDVKELKFHVTLILDKKVDKKHFVDLDQRVRKLEKK